VIGNSNQLHLHEHKELNINSVPPSVRSGMIATKITGEMKKHRGEKSLAEIALSLETHLEQMGFRHLAMR